MNSVVVSKRGGNSSDGACVKKELPVWMRSTADMPEAQVSAWEQRVARRREQIRISFFMFDKIINQSKRD